MSPLDQSYDKCISIYQLPLYRFFSYPQSQLQEDMKNVLEYDPLDLVECLQFHLKKVVLKNYDGDKRSFADFAKFFILNAKVLKKMEIGVINDHSDKWMHRQRS